METSVATDAAQTATPRKPHLKRALSLWDLIYYGIILTSNHTPGRARPFLESAQDAPLLPEERALVDKAVQETAAAPH